MACAAEIPKSPWPAAMSSSRLGCLGQAAISFEIMPAVGATKGTIARANLIQTGLSGDMLASPRDPPLRAKEDGSVSHSPIISGDARKSMMPPMLAGDARVRNVWLDGVSR